MNANEKARPALQCQTSRREIKSRVIIPRQDDFRPVCLWGFMGSVKDLKSFLKAQRTLLDERIILP